MRPGASSPVKAGFWACLPAGLGSIPFAVVVAVGAAEAGLTPAETLGMSLIVFAGVAQLAAVELLRTGTPGLVIVGVTVLINLRFVLYSATLRGWFADVGRGGRVASAQLLTDQAFATTAAAHAQSSVPEGHEMFRYYLGAGLCQWSCWQGGTALGVAFGALLPDSPLWRFSVALVFIGLGVPALRNKGAVVAAGAAIVVAVLCRGLPYGGSILAGAAAGMVAGALFDRGQR